MASLAVYLCLAHVLIFYAVECKDRVYYIAAVNVDWDYAPTGKNLKNGLFLDKDE